MEISQLQESLQSLNQTMREKQELSNETITRMSQQLKTQIELKESIQVSFSEKKDQAIFLLAVMLMFCRTSCTPFLNN